MAYLTWVARILLFLVLLSLAGLNLETAHLRGFFGLEWQGPLAVALLAALLLGVLMGIVASFRLALLLRSPEQTPPVALPDAEPPAWGGTRPPKAVRPSGAPDDAGV